MSAPDIDLRCGRWQDVLQDVDRVDAVITDPPYGARTHKGHDAGVAMAPDTMRNDIDYTSWSPDDVAQFAPEWSYRCRGWVCALTSHDLFEAWELAHAKCGRYVFAPLPVIVPGMTVRLAGDGPSSESVTLVVARPRSAPWSKWGTLRGFYMGSRREPVIVRGQKPLAIMRAIISDYTRPGDLVCDPCAGGGTTAIACAELGRRFIGAEMDPETHAKAIARIERGYTMDMFAGSA